MSLDRKVAAARPGRDGPVVTPELSPVRLRAELFVRRVVPHAVEKLDGALHRFRQRESRHLVGTDRAPVEAVQRRRRLADRQQRRRQNVLVGKLDLVVADEVPGELGGPRLDDPSRIDPARPASFNLVLNFCRDEKLLLEEEELSFEIRFITVGTFVEASAEILSNAMSWNNQTVGFEGGRHLLQDEFVAAEADFVIVLVERVLAKVAAAAADADRLHRLRARVRVGADDLRIDGRRKIPANAADVPRVSVSTSARVFDVLGNFPA